MRTLKLLSFILVILAPLSCKKGGCNVIPDVYFRVSVPQSKLAVMGNFSEEKGGYAGVLLVNTPYGIKAYDRCSTVNPGQRNAVIVDEGGLTATDPVSGAQFILMNGSPVRGAECPL